MTTPPTDSTTGPPSDTPAAPTSSPTAPWRTRCRGWLRSARRALAAPPHGWRGLWTGLLLAAALLATHAASTLGAHTPSWPQGPDMDTLVALGARADAPLAAGEVERLVTAVFLHGGLAHAATNALWTLLLILSLARLAVPPMWAVSGWVLGGAAGMAASWAWAPGVTVGASGAVFALFAWLVVLTAHRKRGAGRALPVALLLAALAAPALSAQVDLAAHAGGAAVGTLLGLLSLGNGLAPGAAPARLVPTLVVAVLAAAAAARWAHVVSPAPLVSAWDVEEPPTTSPPPLLRPSRVSVGLPLPRLGRPGAWRDGGCQLGATPRDGELDCQLEAGGFLALSGPWSLIARASQDVPHPPPGAHGRCVWVTLDEQTAVVVRGAPTDAGTEAPALVFAALSSQWEGYRPLWRAATACRCRGIGSPGRGPRRDPTCSARRRRAPPP